MRRAAVVLGVLSLLLGGVANGLTLSTESSDETPASVLDATFDIQVSGGNTLQLTVTNDTTAPDTFNINEVFFNGPSGTGLSLASATHSVNGDVFASWNPVETVIMVNGWGDFDFALTNGVGANNPSVIQPGANVVFVLDISGGCAATLSCTSSDFASALSSGGYLAAAKFVNGPGDDSAFGAVIPEPSTAALLALGLVGIAARRRAARA